MDAISLLRQQFQEAHQFVEMTMQDVTAEQAHWAPPGKASPLGANYAHLVTGEDFIIQGMLKGGAPLAAAAGAGKVGVSELPPQDGAWDQWARQVKVDLPALKQYAQSVYAASDEYIASLTPDDLSRPLDLSAAGFGQQTMAFMLNIAVGHANSHMGEISCLKGLQGAKGYPF